MCACSEQWADRWRDLVDFEFVAVRRSKEAAAAYDDELLRTPNRTPSVKGLASAKEKLRTTTTSAAR